MVANGLKKYEIDAINILRDEVKDMITPNYDTDFNLLRWAQGYDYNLDEAKHNLRRHLQVRRFFDLDNIDQLVDDKMLKRFFPLGLVGETGKNNHLLVVECAGRIDLQGILLTVQLNKFLTQRLKFQEMMLREINAVEARTGAQCSVIYLLDLEGLKLDSKLLSIVTGPYHILWNLVYTNYPEWIDTMFVINAPKFVTVIWRAIAPILPERTRNKVCFFSDNYSAELGKLCDLDLVPKQWGGTMVDKFGDPMCRDRLIIPDENIPKNYYWQPDESAPPHNTLNVLTLPAGRCKSLMYRLDPVKNKKVFIAINRYAERNYSMAIYFRKLCSHEQSSNGGSLNGVASDVEDHQFDEWKPEFIYPAMPTVDLMKHQCLGPGLYKIKFGNLQSWFRPVTISYRIQFLDSDDSLVSFEEIN